MSKDAILDQFKVFSLGTGGIGSWLTNETDGEVFTRLARIDSDPVRKVQLNQLLVLGGEAPVSDDFFRYYWLAVPDKHPYPVDGLPGFEKAWSESSAIRSLNHLHWGLYRIYTDALLYFGNVRTGFRTLRSMDATELGAFFDQRRFDTSVIKNRGPALRLKPIPKDDRYLISEMACKSYGDRPDTPGEMQKALLEALHIHRDQRGGAITIRQLLEGEIPSRYSDQQEEFVFSADDVLDERVESDADLEDKYARIAKKFFGARESALVNTRYYLSMVSDLDVYVATSMRTRKDFRDMADACDKIFSDPRLRDLQLRYFDPTLSAATGHEDKGLIECLMVKCAKVLVYCAGKGESYGKDAEAAMALSLGKPVIFYCDHEQKHRFYRDVHPLSRLIDFETGVAVGAMVTDSLEQVSELLYRIFENRMGYRLEQPKPGYLRLKEELTDAVVRLQTNDRLLTETFWNHYHNR